MARPLCCPRRQAELSRRQSTLRVSKNISSQRDMVESERGEKTKKAVGRTIHECQCAVCQAGTDSDIQGQHRRINIVMSQLNEGQRRWYVGSMSQVTDGPSDQELSRITGLDVKTIRRGRREVVNETVRSLDNRQRQPGG